MKNILFISHSASLTGAPILLQEIASRVDTKRYAMRFIVGDHGPLVERFKKLGPTIVDELYPDEPKYWREAKRVRQRISNLKSPTPNLLFCNSIHTAKWLVYARILGIPAIMHVLELPQGFKTLTTPEHQIIKRLSKHFIAASEAVKRYLVEAQGIDEKKVRVVYAGIDVQRFGKRDEAAGLKKQLGLGNATVIGTVGRITHVKGSDLFVRMAAALKKGGRRVKFLVVATTADKEYFGKFKALVAENRLTDDIVVVEDIAETPAYFAAMDIYVSTAREDPFPLVVLEAMASRLPVAGFASGGIPESVTPECGILVNGEDVDKLTDAVSRLIADPELRTRLGNAGRKRVEEKFTLSRYAEEMEKVIEATLEFGKPG